MNSTRLFIKSLSFLFVLSLMIGCDGGDSDDDSNGGNPQACLLHGHVSDAISGSALPNIHVRLLSNGQLYADQFTTQSGDYSFANVPFGGYSIHFEGQQWDAATAWLGLNTSDYTHNVQLTERYPRILEAHGHLDTPGGVTHYLFYDVRVYDAVGIGSVTAHLSDNSGQNTVTIELSDSDQDGDLEGEHWNTAGINFSYSFGIRAVDTDGNLAEEFFSFE